MGQRHLLNQGWGVWRTRETWRCIPDHRLEMTEWLLMDNLAIISKYNLSKQYTGGRTWKCSDKVHAVGEKLEWAIARDNLNSTKFLRRNAALHIVDGRINLSSPYC